MVIATLLAHFDTPDALSTQAVLALLTALGLSSTAGLRAYLPLLAVAIGSNVDSTSLPLQPSFQALKSPPLMIILGVLVVAEFAVDKVPGLDHLSDVVHTVVRPLSGAIIMAGTQNTLSDINPWVAAVVGAVLALMFHTAKATTRPVVTATTVGTGNPVASVIEDVLSVASVVLLIVLPVIGIILIAFLAIILLLMVFITVRMLRGRGGRKVRQPQPAFATPALGSSVSNGYTPIVDDASQTYYRPGGVAGDTPTLPGQIH